MIGRRRIRNNLVLSYITSDKLKQFHKAISGKSVININSIFWKDAVQTGAQNFRKEHRRPGLQRNEDKYCVQRNRLYSPGLQYAQ